MARIETEDGYSISSSHLMDQLERTERINSVSQSELYCRPVYHEIEKMKVPNGIHNRDRLLNTNTYDLLVHIQQSLSLNNRCILNLITNAEHKCLNTNETIQRRIHQYAEQFIDESFRILNPRSRIQFKIEGTDDQYDYRPETDEEWFDRLCHLIMHKDHPAKLQMIKCEECIQEWLNTSKW